MPKRGRGRGRATHEGGHQETQQQQQRQQGGFMRPDAQVYRPPSARAQEIPPQRPQPAAMPPQRPQAAAIPPQRPQAAAMPSQRPQAVVMPSQRPQAAAMPSQRPQAAAMPLQRPQAAAMPLQRPQAEDIVEDISGLSLQPVSRQKYAMAKRPGYGKNGRRINLFANYFMLNFKDMNIFHYDIDIKFLRAKRKEVPGEKPKEEIPTHSHKKGASILEEGFTAKEAAEKKITHMQHQQTRAPGKQRCREIIHELIKVRELKQYSPCYDGQKNIYTLRELPIDKKTSYEVTLDEDGKYKVFEVIIQPVEKKGGRNIITSEQLNNVLAGRSKEIPHEMIMALDTIMSQRFPPFHQVQVGRSFFMLNQRGYNLGEGVEIWFGYSQSVRLTERGPAVIVNFSAKVFHQSGPVIEYASDLLNKDIRKLNALDPRDIDRLSKALAKVKVQVTHLRYPRKYPVKGVTHKSARDQRFDNNGRETTVAQYFRQQHNIQLKFAQLPCLHMRSSNNTTFIPMELCEVVPNQPKLGKLSGPMTSEMIKKTAIPPEERFRRIEEKINRELHPSSRESMNAFGLHMEFLPMKLQGRILGAPKLTYGKSPQGDIVAVPDPQGKWRITQNFYRSRENATWVLLNFSRTDQRALENLANVLVRAARDVKMKLEAVATIRSYHPRDSLRQALKYAKGLGVSFAVVVLSEQNRSQTYEEVKYIADIELQLVTQCVKDRVVCKFSPQVATNLLLKINAKLGGVNHALLERPLFFNRPVIVFGADAIHSPRGFACPSIAAVVGSLDAFPSQYAVTCRVQKNPDETKLSQEIIVELKDMVKSILEQFKQRTRGKYPEKIIFFRDGVSEGQFNVVLEEEIEKVQLACKEALDGNIPPMTFIIVQKRHQTRLRPQNPKEGVGRMGNVPPGTTVDTDLVHPVFFDFFICSHEGIQGTSKPAHYTVIWDENNFTPDELQQLCYNFCHLYARCNRSISVPPPVMYADLACTRAKKYAELYINSQEAQSTVSSSSGEIELPPEIKNAINETMGTFNSGMFYV